MSNQRTLNVVVAVILILALGLSACGGRTAPGSQGSGDGDSTGQSPVSRVTIAQFTAPGGVFHPQLTTSSYDLEIAALLFSPLLDLNEELEYEPNLAEFEMSDDQLSLTFKLKPGLQWSDGTPVTAEDIKFTFEVRLHPAWPGAGQRSIDVLAGGKALLNSYDELRSRIEPEDPMNRKPGVDYITFEQYLEQAIPLYEQWLASDPIEVVDERTAILHFDEVFAPALQAFGGSLFPKHVYENIPVQDLAKAPATQRPQVVNGPYQLVEVVTDQYVELAPNPSYHKGRPKIERLIFKVVDAEIAIGELQNGSIDAVGVGASLIAPQDYEEIVSKFDHVNAWENPRYMYQYMFINLTHPFLNIKEVRQAMAYAIDRQGIVDELLLGHGTVLHTGFLPIQWAYDAESLNPYPYDPDKARQLLAAAGFADLDGDGVLEKDGLPFEVTLVYPGGTSNPVRQASAPLIQQYLADVGIKVHLEAMEFTTLMQEASNVPGRASPFDLGLLAWMIGIDPDPTGLWGENDLYNLSRWNTETVGEVATELTELIQAGLRTFDQEERRQIYREIGRILNEHLPYVFLYTQNNITVFNKRVRSVNRDIRGALHNVHEWSVSD